MKIGEEQIGAVAILDPASRVSRRVLDGSASEVSCDVSSTRRADTARSGARTSTF